MLDDHVAINLAMILASAFVVVLIGIFTQNKQIMKLIAVFSVALPLAGVSLYPDNPVPATYITIFGFAIMSACAIGAFFIKEYIPQSTGIAIDDDDFEADDQSPEA